MFIGFCYSPHFKIKKWKHREGKWLAQEVDGTAKIWAPTHPPSPLHPCSIISLVKETEVHVRTQNESRFAKLIRVHLLGHSAQPPLREAVSSSPCHTWERLRVPPRCHTQRGHSTEPGSADSGFQVVPGCPALTSDREGRHLNQIPASPRSSRASRRRRLHFLKAPQGKRSNNRACPPPERGPRSHPPRPCVPPHPGLLG